MIMMTIMTIVMMAMMMMMTMMTEIMTMMMMTKVGDHGIHSDPRYRSLSPCTVANVAKVIFFNFILCLSLHSCRFSFVIYDLSFIDVDRT